MRDYGWVIMDGEHFCGDHQEGMTAMDPNGPGTITGAVAAAFAANDKARRRQP